MQKKVWKPTQQECNWIKKAASLESQPRVTVGQLRLEPGIRYNVENDEIDSSFNIALVSDHEDWDDTDLEQTWYWDDFRKGVPLTEDGRAIVDMYIRPKTEAIADANQLDHLLGNVVVFYADGEIKSINGCHRLGDDYLPEMKKGD